MSSMQEDIQCAGSDTRPPMLDRTDFESWQQRIRLYCLGKDNGENIMKSIKEGPFQMGTVSDIIAGETEGAVQQGPVRARVLSYLLAEENERYKADIRATNILLQGIPKDIYSLINHYTDAKDIWENVKMILEGSELTKDDRESQLYDDFEHFRQIKGEIHSRILLSTLVQQYPTQSSKSPQPLKEPSPADNFQLDSGSSSTENLIESLSNTLALLTQSYKSHLLKLTINLELRLYARNKAMAKATQDSGLLQGQMLLMPKSRRVGSKYWSEEQFIVSCRGKIDKQQQKKGEDLSSKTNVSIDCVPPNILSSVLQRGKEVVSNDKNVYLTKVIPFSKTLKNSLLEFKQPSFKKLEMGVNDSTEASGLKPRSNTKKNRILPAKKENKKE
ncbi:hypothetical protein Tco_1055249 [Tanacetum coccineum]|uniref:Retrovirus-related Pol polyprotein from transposon TNT 1-94 n=1 Tax=Tanacetum coccineum TaxID=301880 RepID=A0ABQ5H0Y7_9ASTR